MNLWNLLQLFLPAYRCLMKYYFIISIINDGADGYDPYLSSHVGFSHWMQAAEGLASRSPSQQPQCGRHAPIRGVPYWGAGDTDWESW